MSEKYISPACYNSSHTLCQSDGCQCYCHEVSIENKNKETFTMSRLEVSALVKEFSHSFINTNENPLASQVMERMIKFVEDK